MQTQQGLAHLDGIFALFIKNNPALLYAKFNDQLITIKDKNFDLKDMLLLLQLQKLSTSLLSSTHLYTFYAEIKNLAKINKLSLFTKQLFSNLHLLYQSQK